MPLDLSAVVLGVGIIIASQEFVCNRLGTNSGSMGTIRYYSKYSKAEAVKICS